MATAPLLKERERRGGEREREEERERVKDGEGLAIREESHLQDTRAEHKNLARVTEAHLLLEKTLLLHYHFEGTT